MTVEERVKMVIAKTLGINDPEKIKLNSSIIDDLGADSLDTVELVMDMEQEFKIEISDEDAQGLTIVSKIISYIEGRIK